MAAATKVFYVLFALSIILLPSALCQTTTAPSGVPTCTTAGRIADPTNCRNYFLCSVLADGGFIQMLYTCPGESSFDPTTLKCSLIPTCDIPVSSTTTTTTKSPITIASSPFECPTATGKFADPDSCTKYFMCSASVAYSYSCPSKSLFDPTTSKCSLLYVCPV